MKKIIAIAAAVTSPFWLGPLCVFVLMLAGAWLAYRAALVLYEEFTR